MNFLVVDDHLQIAENVKNILKTCPDAGDIDVFRDGLSACASLSRKSYGLCIVDIRLPGMDGFALTEQIRKTNPGAKVVINTMCEELWDAKRILELDADGIVIKTSSFSRLKEGIDAVLAGKKYRCPKFRNLDSRQRNTDSLLDLSPREIEVLKAIADGLTTEDMSRLHGISENTVESIRKRLLLKFDARNMAQLVGKAHKIGLITNYCINAPPD